MNEEEIATPAERVPLVRPVAISDAARRAGEELYLMGVRDGVSMALSKALSGVFASLCEVPDSGRQQRQRRAAAQAFIETAVQCSVSHSEALELLRKVCGQDPGKIGHPL